jgi:predicted cobalt transporter CbtA
MYIVCLGTQAYRGSWAPFLGGFSRLPWSDPRVPGALAAGAVALALALGLPGRLGRLDPPRSALATLRARNLLSSALLVAVAVSGLYLGVKLGPPAASLSLVLILAPMVRGWFVLPREARWRAAIGRGSDRT